MNRAQIQAQHTTNGPLPTHQVSLKLNDKTWTDGQMCRQILDRFIKMAEYRHEAGTSSSTQCCYLAGSYRHLWPRQPQSCQADHHAQLQHALPLAVMHLDCLLLSSMYLFQRRQRLSILQHQQCKHSSAVANSAIITHSVVTSWHVIIPLLTQHNRKSLRQQYYKTMYTGVNEMNFIQPSHLLQQQKWEWLFHRKLLRVNAAKN